MTFFSNIDRYLYGDDYSCANTSASQKPSQTEGGEQILVPKKAKSGLSTTCEMKSEKLFLPPLFSENENISSNQSGLSFTRIHPLLSKKSQNQPVIISQLADDTLDLSE